MNLVAYKDFWCSVAWRSNAIEKFLILLRFVLAEAKIGDQTASVASEENILRLQIQVENLQLVNFLQTGDNLSAEISKRFIIQFTAVVQQTVQTSFGKCHGDVAMIDVGEGVEHLYAIGRLVQQS